MPPQIRLMLLNLMGLSIVLTIGKIILDPTAGKRPFALFDFPDSLPLTGWELVNSQPLIDPTSSTTEYDRILSSKQYDYQQNGNKLHLEIRYVVNTSGDVMELFQRHNPTQGLSEVRQAHGNQGFYNSFTTPEQLHLTSCINPRGNSTATVAQFFHNRYTYDFQPTHLLDWGLGQENLIDQRCLWLHLSTPLPKHGHDRSIAILENAWQSLTVWGQTQFPKP